MRIQLQLCRGTIEVLQTCSCVPFIFTIYKCVVKLLRTKPFATTASPGFSEIQVWLVVMLSIHDLLL